jgi:cytidylate kinase
MAIITISRAAFSGGRNLAEYVAARLGYRCMGREALAGASREYNVSEEKLSRALIGEPGALEHLYSNRTRYLACVRAILIRESKDEKLVYHGHAGHLLLKGVPNTIRVKIVAGMEFRIRALTYHHVSKRDAIQYIRKLDKEREKWTRLLYHVDWNDPSLYDIVMHVDNNKDISRACNILCQMATMNDYEATAWSHKIMDDLALSSHIKANLATDQGIGDAGIEVRSDNGVVSIGGTVEWVEDIDKVERVVCSIPGVEKVISTVEPRMSWGDTEGLRVR